MTRFQQTIGIVSVLLVGCNPAPERDSAAHDSPAEGTEDVQPAEDLDLTYVGTGEATGGTSGGGEVPPFKTCALTAPYETVVLVEATRDFESGLYDPCDTDRPIYSNHVHTSLRVMRQTGPTVPETLDHTYWLPGISDVNINSNTPAGTMLLASVRQAGDDWIVMAAVQVEHSGTGGTVQEETLTSDHRPIELPHSWSEIVSESADVRDNYASRCDENPYYLDGTRRMDPAEFDNFIHTYRPPAKCSADAGDGDAG